MKIEKINLEGKKGSVEVKDSVFLSKINEKLISSVIYKTNANFKGRSSKTKQKNGAENYTIATDKIVAMSVWMRLDWSVQSGDAQEHFQKGFKAFESQFDTS